MSDKQKEIINNLANSLEKMDFAEQMYIAGFAAGKADNAKEKDKGEE